MADTRLELGNRKLVILGIPWDVNTDGLRQYMNKYGSLDDVVVMRDRRTGRSRGFGYVTFSSSESAEKALAARHTINGRELEVKVATPKEDMKNPAKRITRIFVARIPHKVSEDEFRKYFEEFGTITDIYMPKESGTKSHRGIGFITFEDAESVSKVMAQTHEIGGSTVAVDEATAKDEGGSKTAARNEYFPARSDYSYSSKFYDREYGGAAYGAYSPYIAASAGVSRYGGYGGISPYDVYDYPYAGEYGSSRYGGGNWSSFPPIGSYGGGDFSGKGRSSSHNPGTPPGGGSRNKIFVGRLPSGVTSEDLRQYFGNFGRVLDVFLPKDPKRSGHRGFAFVTFTDEGPAERVCRRPHEILGHEIAVDRASPPDDAGPGDAYYGGGFGGSATTAYPGIGLDFYRPWGGGSGGSYGSGNGGSGPMLDPDRSSRDFRYRPY